MKKRISILALICALAGAQVMPAVVSAADRAETDAVAVIDTTVESSADIMTAPDHPVTTYEIFVGSFADSNGDGIGDLAGIEEKLDYIAGSSTGNAANADDSDSKGLGFDAIWTTPIFPSPTYHKYDVTDYTAIDPAFGTMEDFDTLLTAMHDRGMKLYLDLPVNHTSLDHPWFQEAAAYLADLPADTEPNAADCPHLTYYNFTREKKSGYEALKGTDWFYEARFWSGMPDLNLDSEEVRSEIKDIVSFWLGKGVDGFRLDAVTSYYTEDEKATAEFLTWLVSTAKSIDPDCYIVGEAWEDQNRYARLYETGIDSLFDFAFSGQDGIIANVVKGAKKPAAFVDAMVSEEELFESYSDSYINAPFYTNHDMARSTGYYAYDDGSKTKLAAAMNLLMPGNAFVYYGEELGMKGSGKDENKRAPMQWSTNPEADGMCDAPEGMDQVKMKFGSFEEQEEDPTSIWNYYREAIKMRREYPVLASGKTVKAEVGNDQVAAFERTDEETKLLVIINPTETAQDVELKDSEQQNPKQQNSEQQNPESQGTELQSAALTAQLNVADEEAAMEDGTLELPAFGIAILTLTD